MVDTVMQKQLVRTEIQRIKYSPVLTWTSQKHYSQRSNVFRLFHIVLSLSYRILYLKV